ncbi:insulin receptor substrate 1-B isoform X2 [Zophobas morio]|uniref:insulin receptor substrate 1-B isoform X2 n=1 Tax=Zophobas morio TaxID=2755281 RepID=UPI003083A345
MSVMKGCEGGGNVVRCGYLKKLKTSRKKFFVLRAETAEASARLEYYDSERKFHGGQPPKRSIPLKNCFNINRRLDTKHKHVIALYTKDDCFCVVLESEEDVDGWLKALLKLQHGEEVVDGEAPKPTFEHVWQVTVLNRGLGNAGLVGNYRLCLTDKTLSLIKRDCEVPQIELNLTNIRSCGNLRDFFFLEIGRSSTLGAGELWMQTEDNNIAQNIHSTVFHAMSTNSNKEDLCPKSRNRSSSATESSKPNNMTRKIHNIPPKCHILPQDISHSTTDTQVPTAGSSSQHPIVSGVASFYQHLIQRGTSKAAERRHSISGSVTQSGTISHQRTQSLPLANPPAPISDQNTSHPLRVVAKRSNQSSKCMSGGRERCDSMPSRARTTSEGTHPMWNQTGRCHLNPYRPASLYGRDISHSPPSGSPVSPPSVGCSTDSAGSSYSLTDETDVCTELDPTLGRYGHSLTPDEAIAEEECPDSPPYTNNYVSMAMHSSDDGYVDMSPKGRHHNNSPTASLSSVTSGTPSTDMRFADFRLEKVTSYLTSEDDDARPTRAYSVGSKPEGYKKYTEMLAGNSDNLRVRALSVGSKKGPGRVLPPHGYHAHQGAKSSSAPILSNSRGQGSHNSIGPMDDLMEMDFSSRSGSSVNNSGYMDMRPGPKNNHGYVEMKPGRKPDTSPYVDMSQGSSPAKPSYISPQSDGFSDVSNDYMEMDPRKNSTYHNNNNNNNNGDYLTMSFKRPPSNYQLSPAKASPLGGNYLDSHYGSPKTEPATPDGYVEMSLGRGHQRQSSLDSAQIVNEDYANMSMGKKRDRNSRKKEKARSQPIAIQNPGGNAPKGSAGSSSPRYALLGRKYSTGTPPMHLPLAEATPYASLPRQQRRRDSKDSSSSSVTTPSSSSTIFPFSLNSPCSPAKPDKKKTESDYTPMDFEGRSDYVNYNPKTPVNEDYAVMKPGVRVSSPSVRMAVMQLSDSAQFRPINETRDDAPPPEGPDPPYEVLRARPESGRSSLSRPSSTSSELCSSGSTVVGSRPESVNSDRARPASVSSADVQLHYASLDLDEGNRSPRTVKGAAGEAQAGAEVTLTYAAIDFVKSEGLKHNSLATNAKVKH